MNRRLIQRLLVFPSIVAISLALAACSSGKPEAASSTEPVGATTASTAIAVPTAQAQAPTPVAPNGTPPQAATTSSTVPDGSRIYEDVKYLSLAPRPSGTAQEKAAADFVADKLRSAGYEVSFQEFPVQTQAREAALATRGAGGAKLTTIPLQGSGSGKVLAQVVAAGIGRPEEFPAAVKGAVALIQRGQLTFNDKVINAQAAGAMGVIIFNNERDVFNGSLATAAKVPVVAISQADGNSLLAALDRGRVEVDLSVGDNGQATSRNVIAKPPGQECETVTGGHYDSVPAAPGASDNATGTATVVEIATIMANKGEMGSNCFILFGSEELGLIGSRFYVDSLNAQARSRIKAMFNYDMVGVGSDGWLFIGDANLQRLAQAVGARVGVTGALAQLRGASSDHASFSQAGIPAFMLYRTTDNLLHTPQDVIDRVQPDLLEQAAKLGVALLESVNAGS